MLAVVTMTGLERDLYHGGQGVDVMAGYPPPALLETWMREAAEHPPAGWLDDPLRFLPSVESWLASLTGCGMRLADSCTDAFTMAVQAVAAQHPHGVAGRMVVFGATSFGVWPDEVAAHGGIPAYAWRQPDGCVDPDSVALLLEAGAWAVVLVIPDNPTGVVQGPSSLRRIAGLCADYGAVLIVDYCLAGTCPPMMPIPKIAEMAIIPGLSWIVLADTRKLIGLGGHGFGAIGCSPDLDAAVARAADIRGYLHRPLDLAVLGRICSAGRGACLLEYRRRMARLLDANHARLAAQLGDGLSVRPRQAGPFAIIDREGGMDCAGFAATMREAGVHAVPGHLFPPGADSCWVRVALARDPAVMDAVAAAASA